MTRPAATKKTESSTHAVGGEEKWMAHVRVLIYPIIFERYPYKKTEAILHHLTENNSAQRDWSEYLESVRTALASNVSLADLLPQDHSEDIIRAYLRQIETHLSVKMRSD